MGFHYAPTHTGLRDRALLGTLAYTFARIGAQHDLIGSILIRVVTD